MSSSFYTLVQSPSSFIAATSAAAAAAAGPGPGPGPPPTANEEVDHDGGIINFIQQITGASYPKTWDHLTDQEQKKVLSCLFEEGIHSKKVLFSTLVQLEYISKKGATPFTTTTTAVELDEWDDDWKIGEYRILCLTSACTSTWTQLYSLEFVSPETGSVCTLELQHDFNFRYSIPDKQFVVFDRKLKDKCKRLVFATTSSDKLVDFVEILNRSLATISDYTQRKMSSDSLATPPVQHSSQPPSFPSASTSAAGAAPEPSDMHESLTAKRIIEIIRKLFERKDAKERRGKIKKIDISAPSDFRHVQHFGAWDARASETGTLIVSNMQDLVNMPTTPNGTTVDGGNGNPSSPNPTSPTRDKRTLSFIYDVIEECNNAQPPPPSRSALRSDNRQTVQLPVVPQMTESDIRSLFDTKNKSQSNQGRSKLIQDLKVHLQDEDTRKLIFEFIETYKQEVQSDRGELEKDKRSPSPSAGTSSKAGSNSKWSSGRNIAPPPPKSPTRPIDQDGTGAAKSINNKLDETKHTLVDGSPFDYSAVRNSLRVELQQNMESQIKPGCQEKGAAALLARSNTWSTNQLKGPGSGFSTLPSPKPSLSPGKVKKTHSEIRRRPTTPPPPPMTEARHGNGSSNSDEDVHAKDRNGNRSTPEPDPPPHPEEPNTATTTTTKKKVLPPPIPKPRTSKMLVRRINSNPSSDVSEIEPRYANIHTSRSFDTETGVGSVPGEADGHGLILPARPQVPSTVNSLLVAELREKIDGIKQ